MARERQTEAVTQLIADFVECDGRNALPAFSLDRLPSTARQFLDVVVLPLLLRALFGEDLTALRAEIGPHVTGSVAFFLVACGCGPNP